MANSTDKSILTAAGKALLAQLNAEEKALVIDKMIFANVPNRPEYPQPDDVVPTDHIVHQEQVEQRGRLSADSVIYSSTLTSDVGPFDFNWTGAYCSEYGVLVTIDHHALTPKTADEPGVAGNTLVRSVVLEYKDIAEITNITVDASSWQYNATERMKKMDSDVAQSIIDQNGKDWFIEDGFLVTPSGSAYSIKAGAGYVSGNRVAMEFDRSVQVPNKPSFIYIDAHREGTPTGEQVTLFNFVVTAEEKDDYIDSSTGKDVKHFVCKIAQVLADGSVSDLRPEGESASREWVKNEARILAKNSTHDRTLSERFSDRVNVKDFGAKGFPHDDYLAFKDAVTAVKTGGIIDVPFNSIYLSSEPNESSKIVTFNEIEGNVNFNGGAKYGSNSLSKSAFVNDTVDYRYSSLTIYDDAIDPTLTGGVFVNGHKALMYPSADWNGGRQAVVGQVLVNHASKQGNPNVRAIGVVGHVRCNVEQGGTAPTLTDGVGSFFAMNPYVYLGPDAKNIRLIAGAEVNTVMREGSTVGAKVGWNIVSSDDIGTEATGVDCGIHIGAMSDAEGYKTGLLFSRLNGGRGVKSGGTFIEAKDHKDAVMQSLLRFPDISWTGDIIYTDVFAVRNDGSLKLGNGSAGCNIDVFTDNTSHHYDVSLKFSGGTGEAGSGTMQIAASQAVLPSISRPSGDDVAILGHPSFRWSNIYAASGVVNTSDATCKTTPEPIDDSVLDAWADVEFEKYKFLDAISNKGDSARWHIGVIAQKVEQAFASHGLNAFELGLLCFDEWEEQEEIKIVHPAVAAEYDPETGGVITPEAPERVEIVQEFVPAGSRYGVRYEEALCLESALMRRELNRMNKRLLSISNQVSN
ncbi:phage tail protein [Vibrio sp. CUB2]|uniref:phage tail-collar fiber domain-containing protein n=1 Tax=Vibrio sp. CUB2 TaxID=2315233 RepID=UPI00076A6ACC|nr:phage tail protein [Vibrio sp. CUB2]